MSKNSRMVNDSRFDMYTHFTYMGYNDNVE